MIEYLTDFFAADWHSFAAIVEVGAAVVIVVTWIRLRRTSERLERLVELVQQRTDVLQRLLTDEYQRLRKSGASHPVDVPPRVDEISVAPRNMNHGVAARDAEALPQRRERSQPDYSQSAILVPPQPPEVSAKRGIEPELDRQPPLSPEVQKLTSNYNQATRDPKLIPRFNATFPFRRLGPANASDIKRDPGLQPVFAERDDGEYFAVKLVSGEERGTYAVLPRFGLVYQDTAHGPGGFSHVFECMGYEPGLTFHDLRLVEPALFEYDEGGHRWTLVRHGALDLGSPDQH